MSEFLMAESTDQQVVTQGVAFFASSELFLRLYDQAMDLVREAADYLELDGALEREALPKDRALVYSCESMRLTTRLMQISAWLLAMRAIKESELTGEDLAAQHYRLGGRDVCLGGPVRGAGMLPTSLIELLGISKRLYEQIMRIDGLLFNQAENRKLAENPVDQHHRRIEQAFVL